MQKGDGIGTGRKHDGYLAAAVVAAAFLLWILQHTLLSAPGQQVTVTQDGVVVGIYPLSEENVLTFTDKKGGRNVLAIRDGTACMEEADCPDGLCMRQKEIAGKGESIICLPHRLVVEVTAGEPAETDAVAR